MVAVDEKAKTIRIRDSQLILLAVGIAFTLTASAPHLIIRLRPVYSITFSGYVMSATFGLVALLCFWMQLKTKANDLTVDLANRTVAYRSTFGERTLPLAGVSFTTRTTMTEALGNSVEGVAVQVEGNDLDLNVLNFTSDQHAVVDGFTGILANAATEETEQTLRSVATQAAQLPPHMLGQIFGALALMVGASFWLVARYVLSGP